MKRFSCTILIAIVIISLLSVHVNATETSENIFYMDDGSYIIAYTEELGTRASTSKTGKRIFEYYNNNDEMQWKATLTAKYLYTGTTATCTSSQCDVTVYNSDWYVVDKSSGMLGGKATADITMGRKVLGVTVEKKNVSMSLTCDANGNLS